MTGGDFGLVACVVLSQTVLIVMLAKYLSDKVKAANQ